MVGHDRDGVVEPYDLTHALDGLGLRIVHALHATAEDGRLCEGRDLHARRPSVDAIHGRSVDLRRRVQTLGRGADELELLRSLEHHALGNGQVGGGDRELAIFKASPGRRVTHFTALCAAGCRIDIPALCRRRNQHGSRGRAGLAQGLPRRAYRVRVARCLDPTQQRIAVKLFVGRSMFQPYLFQVHLQFFGDQHRYGRVGALSHLHVAHGQCDPARLVDADECVGYEGLFVRAFGRAGRTARPAGCEGDQQASAQRRGCLQETAPGKTCARRALHVLVNAIEDHVRHLSFRRPVIGPRV